MKDNTPNSKGSKISLSTKIFWERIVLGILWLLIAVTGLFRDIWLLDMVHLLSLLSAIGLFIAISKLRSDDFDEMALANQHQAKAKTLDILTYVLFGFAVTVLAVSSLFPELLPRLFAGQELFDLVIGFIFLFLGLQNLCIGMIFRKLEAN